MNREFTSVHGGLLLITLLVPLMIKFKGSQVHSTGSQVHSTGSQVHSTGSQVHSTGSQVHSTGSQHKFTVQVYFQNYTMRSVLHKG